MTTQDSRLAVTNEGGVHRVEFLDRNILEEVSIHAITAEIGQLIDTSDTPKILITFKNVEHLSSAALGALITIGNRVKEKDGQLRLSDINPRVYEIFLITKLNMLFQIDNTEAEALRNFS